MTPVGFASLQAQLVAKLEEISEVGRMRHENNTERSLITAPGSNRAPLLAHHSTIDGMTSRSSTKPALGLRTSSEMPKAPRSNTIPSSRASCEPQPQKSMDSSSSRTCGMKYSGSSTTCRSVWSFIPVITTLNVVSISDDMTLFGLPPQERDQQLQAAQADCSASHAAASAQATALTEKLARVREQYAQELALLNQTVAAAKQAGAESAEQVKSAANNSMQSGRDMLCRNCTDTALISAVYPQATSLDLHLQQCRSQLDQTQQKARHCETELTTALDAARQKAALAAAAAQSGMDALLTQHAEAQEHATAIEADLTAVQQQHADRSVE